MALCLYLFYLVHLVIGYSVEDADVPLPPSYMEQPSQWQSQPMANFPQEGQPLPENYQDTYAQAGDPNAEYEQQYDTQYPRMAASMDQGMAPANDPSLARMAPVNNPSLTGGPSATGVSQQGAPDGQVIPVYNAPKNKHTEKEAEPYIAPQWQSDDGIGDGRDPKIVAALEAITADLIGRGKELTAERKWAKQVESMLELYKEKVTNVHAHTEQIRDEMKTLLKKKRQIENVEVQNQLSQKLRLAQGDLEALDGAMSHVQSKADEFAEKKKKLEQQIGKINDHLQNLQHKQSEESEAAENEEESDTSSTKAKTEKNKGHEGHEGHEKHDEDGEDEATSTKAAKADKADNAKAEKADGEEAEDGEKPAKKNKTDKSEKGEKEGEADKTGKAKAKKEKSDSEEELPKANATSTETSNTTSSTQSNTTSTSTNTTSSQPSSKKGEEAEFRARISSFKKVKKKHHKKSLPLTDEDN